MDRTSQATEAPSVVTAALTYLIDTGEAPVNYPSVGGSDEPTRYDGQYQDRPVIIRNGRAAPGGFELDREGFALVRQTSAVSDFYDDAQIAEVYEPEVTELIKAATGAARVVIFDHTRRAGALATRERYGIREPARNVHNDYTERSGPQRVRNLLPAQEAEALLQRRFAIVNLWRPIRGPVQTSPLALCDARSVAPADLISAERRAKDRVGEIHQVAFNPEHRWFYFPNMQPDEALLIKTYDSATDGRARFTIHTAFDDPATPTGAAPRESIETRCFAFF